MAQRQGRRLLTKSIGRAIRLTMKMAPFNNGFDTVCDIDAKVILDVRGARCSCSER
jgi:hypothetical protein